MERAPHDEREDRDDRDEAASHSTDSDGGESDGRQRVGAGNSGAQSLSAAAYATPPASVAMKSPSSWAAMREQSTSASMSGATPHFGSQETSPLASKLAAPAIATTAPQSMSEKPKYAVQRLPISLHWTLELQLANAVNMQRDVEVVSASFVR